MLFPTGFFTLIVLQIEAGQLAPKQTIMIASKISICSLSFAFPDFQ